jgi:hypothetical protein
MYEAGHIGLPAVAPVHDVLPVTPQMCVETE